MPDLLTHASAGALVLAADRRAREHAPLVLFGCVLPDLMRGPAILVCNALDLPAEAFLFCAVFHAPLMLLLQVAAIVLLFAPELRRRAAACLLAGVATHLFLDAGQRAYHISYYWLFPFSLDNPLRGLWWPDEDGWLRLLLPALALGVWGLRLLLRRRAGGIPVRA